MKMEKLNLFKVINVMIERIRQAGGAAFKVTSIQEVKDILEKMLQEK